MMTNALPSTAARIIDEKMKPLSSSSDMSSQLSSNCSLVSTTLLILAFALPVMLLAMVESSSRAVVGDDGSEGEAAMADDDVDDAVNDSEVNEASTNCDGVREVVVDVVIAVVDAAVVALSAFVAEVSSKLLPLPLLLPPLVIAVVVVVAVAFKAAPPATSIAIDLVGLLVVDAVAVVVAVEVDNAAVLMAAPGL